MTATEILDMLDEDQSWPWATSPCACGMCSHTWLSCGSFVQGSGFTPARAAFIARAPVALAFLLRGMVEELRMRYVEFHIGNYSDLRAFENALADLSLDPQKYQRVMARLERALKK